VGGVFEMNPLLSRRFWLAQAGLLCALALGGCATYQPPSLPDNQLATIGVDANDFKLKFISVDGAFISSIGRLNSFSGRSELKIQPGKRSIQMDYSNLYQERGTSTLVFEAQAGRRYTVHERTEGHRFVTWVTSDGGEKVPLLPKE
jgi:hypothetical protein